ncbi:hypothetical protein [Winogradskyella sp. A3E31]|uniref:hypothetical protein n=1 Tax=Winogradskyella sp. A3E31 TaxID=3349637 RepID=UPI00398BA80F
MVLKKILKIVGVLIMLMAFPLIPDHYPWYYQVLLFNVGLVLFLSTKWNKLKNELGIINKK